MTFVNEFIASFASSPFVLLAVFLIVIMDGFFPPIPSETVIVALAAVAIASGVPSPWLVVLIAALGSFFGDNAAYLIGRSVGTTRFTWMRRPRVARLLTYAGSELRRRPATVIFTARFVPIGRVAVNSIAGASHFPHRKFLILAAASGIAWASYSVAIGVLAGWWLRDNPFLSAVLAICIALAIGFVADRLRAAFGSRRQHRHENSPVN